MAKTKTTNRPPLVVAELHSLWRGDDEYKTDKPTSISTSFNEALAYHEKRGYRLKDWQLTTIAENGDVLYSIVALFERAVWK